MLPNMSSYLIKADVHQIITHLIRQITFRVALIRTQTGSLLCCLPPSFHRSSPHIRRFQEYFNHINILISSSTLQFLQFWYQNGVNYLFLIVKSIEVTSGFISKVLKKIARWRHNWNFWHWIVKPNASSICFLKIYFECP